MLKQQKRSARKYLDKNLFDIFEEEIYISSTEFCIKCNKFCIVYQKQTLNSKTK